VSEGELENGIKGTLPPCLDFAVYHLQHSSFTFKDLLPSTMGRKTLSREGRAALARTRGYFAQTTPEQQKVLGQIEQRSLSGATKVKHVDVGNVFQEYVRLDTMYSATNGDIRFLDVKGIQIESSLQHDSALYEEFVKYYALSRYGRIEELPTVHSVLNMWHRYVGYHNWITKSKLDKNIVSDVAGV
jgi:hypothetical protein